MWCNVNFEAVFFAVYIVEKAKKIASKWTLHHIGNFFICYLTEIKFEIWRVTFLNVFCHWEIMGWTPGFSRKPETTRQSTQYKVWFDFCFTAIQHNLCHFGRGQLAYPNCSWASLLGSLPVLSAHSFASNWQLLFLNQRKWENGRRNVFMTKSQRKNVPCRTWGSNSGPLPCQADTLPIELPRPAPNTRYRYILAASILI